MSPLQRPEPAPKQGFLATERGLWQVATGVFCAFAVLKGTAGPSAWAYTQALLDYSHGFTKRGLEGELLRLLHVQTIPSVTVVFVLQLVVLLLVWAALTRRVGAERVFGSLAPVAVFASSYVLTYLTYVLGYTDIVLYACTAALLLIEKPMVRFCVALVVVPAALLIHENYLLLALSPLLFSFAVDAATSAPAARRRTWLMGVAVAAVALGTALLTALRPRLSPAESLQFAHELQARIHFEPHMEVFRVLARPLPESMRQAWVGLHEPQWSLLALITLANLLPPMWFLLHLARRVLRERVAPESAVAARWLWVAALVTVCAPLPLYFLGFDFARWNSACAVAAYLVLLVVVRAAGQAAVPLTTAERNVAVLLLAFNMATGFGFFGDSMTHPYPFLPALSEDLR